jgi:hypothetical protein
MYSLAVALCSNHLDNRTMACFLPLLTCYSAKDEIEFNGGQQDVGSNFLRIVSWDFRDNRTPDVSREAQEANGNRNDASPEQ